jgi:hypothetical protein
VSVPLDADGPWFTFWMDDQNGHRHLWAVNSDGTGMTSLADFGTDVMTHAIQPELPSGGDRLVAYVTALDYESRDITLNLRNLQTGEVRVIAKLINDREGQPPISIGDFWSSLQLLWSSDDQRLVFTGQIDGESMDVYLYDLPSGTITRLSSGPTQAENLRWSPDEQWVIHSAFDFIGMGEPQATGMWAARTDGKGSITIFDAANPETALTGNYHDYGWLNNSELLMADWQYSAETEVQAVDITTGARRTLFKAKLGDLAYAPEYGVWLISPPYNDLLVEPLQMFRNGDLIDIPGYEDIETVYWLDGHDVFLAMSRDKVFYTITPAGEVTRLPIDLRDPIYGHPITFPTRYVSPDKSLWAWHSDDYYTGTYSVWVGAPMANPVLIAQSTYDPVWWRPENIYWSPDSQSLFIVATDGLWIADRPDFPLRRIIAGTGTNHEWSGCCGQWLSEGQQP